MDVHGKKTKDTLAQPEVKSALHRILTNQESQEQVTVRNNGHDQTITLKIVTPK